MLRVTGGSLRSTIDDALKRSPLPRLASPCAFESHQELIFLCTLALFETQGEKQKNKNKIREKQKPTLYYTNAYCILPENNYSTLWILIDM